MMIIDVYWCLEFFFNVDCCSFDVFVFVDEVFGKLYCQLFGCVIVVVVCEYVDGVFYCVGCDDGVVVVVCVVWFEVFF